LVTAGLQWLNWDPLGAEVQAEEPVPVFLFQWEMTTGRIAAQPSRTQAFVNEVPARPR
jgi:hypothetical protein